MIYIHKIFTFSILLLVLNCGSWTVGIVTNEGDRTYMASNKAKKEMLKNDPSVETGKLDNGLTYYIKNNSYPENRLELLLVVNTGSVMEDDDQQGLAHFAEHMAFNGTEKFPKQDLVDYLELIGMQFGPDLNAYTSFDETVYMLQVPTENKETVDKGFEILSQWANYISFDDDEIDKERGVIVEEWRLRRGAQARLRDKKLPIYFKGSKYAERSPIGKMEIVENFEYDVIKRFYKDWYRPDLMAVVAVGDVSVEDVEGYIKKHFSIIESVENSRERNIEKVPSFDNYRVAIASDPELPMPSVSVTYFLETDDTMDEMSSYKKNLMQYMVREMLNVRLSDLTKVDDPDLIYAGSYDAGRYIRDKRMFGIYGGVQENKIKEGFASIVREIERIIRHGYTISEFERVKAKILNDLETSFNEKDKTESRKFKFLYKDHYLSGENYISIEDKLDLFKFVGLDLELNEVNSEAIEYLGSNNKVLDIDFPEKDNLEIFTEEEVVSIYENVLAEDIAKYEEESLDANLFSRELIDGEILTEFKQNDIDVIELSLSNGIKVVYKNTDFKNDEVLFTAFSPGGHSLIGDDKYFAATEAADIISSSGLGPFDQIQLDKYLSDKNVEVTPFIRELTEGFTGSSSKKDLETMFQMINLYFTEPHKDSTAFNSYIKRMKGFIENKNLSPERVFFDSVRTIINSNNLRSQSLTLKSLYDIKLEDVVSIYKNRFINNNDFTFIFVGNIEEDLFKGYLKKYIASIPSVDRFENWKDVGKVFPGGITNENIYKGMEPKSFVYLTFSGQNKWSEQNTHELNTFTNSFSSKLEKVLRERMGGTYGVWVPSSQNKYPNEKYSFRVIFGCDPDKVDTLTQALFAQIDSVKNFGLDEEFLNKTKEQQRKAFEKNIRENKYWLDELKAMYLNNSNTYKLNGYDSYIDNVGYEDIQRLANKYLNTENYVKAVLYPEK